MDYRNSALVKAVPSGAKESIRRVQRRRKLRTNGSTTSYTCPLCHYTGPFLRIGSAPSRDAAACPQCGALERHRLQSLVLDKLLAKSATSDDSAVLHFAPEAAIGAKLANHFQKYETADLFDEKQTHIVDISQMPFDDGSYDCIYASHVLEHVANDRNALSEIYRVLKPGGFAVLPVPVICDETIEYPEPSPTEFYHVRAPGLDYFHRYKEVFDDVSVFESSSFEPRYQLYAIEDRSIFPTENAPWRSPQSGERHSDYVPVCHKAFA